MPPLSKKWDGRSAGVQTSQSPTQARPAQSGLFRLHYPFCEKSPGGAADPPRQVPVTRFHRSNSLETLYPKAKTALYPDASTNFVAFSKLSLSDSMEMGLLT